MSFNLSLEQKYFVHKQRILTNKNIIKSVWFGWTQTLKVRQEGEQTFNWLPEAKKYLNVESENVIK